MVTSSPFVVVNRVEGIDVYRPGTVIGKALEHHNSGKGMIEVFVALR